jgi:hypothetical protein
VRDLPAPFAVRKLRRRRREMSKDYMDAEDSINQSIWKLETIADMLSVMSDMKRAELRQESFYGISLIIR